MGMVGRRSPAAVIGIGVLALATLVGCGSDADQADDGAGAPTSNEASALEGPFPLPFGIEQPDGLEPIGRPLDHIRSGVGVWIEARTVLAAYRVTAEDPLAALWAWIDQLDDMNLGEGTVTPGSQPELWAQATAYPDFGPEPSAGWVDLQLWATDEDPILLVWLSQPEAEQPRPITFRDEAGDLPHPRSGIEDQPRSDGDALFTEQGQTIHLPPGTRALMPTLPTFAGTGGSTSVLAADDGEAAVQALLDEARSLNERGEVYDHETTEDGGTVITTATFNISAGGWGFDVMAIRGPGDPHATLYVSSYAD